MAASGSVDETSCLLPLSETRRLRRIRRTGSNKSRKPQEIFVILHQKQYQVSPRLLLFLNWAKNSKKANSALILAGALSLAGVGGCRYLSACSCSRVRVPSPSSRRSAKRVELRRPFRSFWVLGFGFWEKLVKAQKGFASRSPASVADLADGGGDALRCGEGNGDGEGRGCLLGG
jgi:hypothetical protein